MDTRRSRQLRHNRGAPQIMVPMARRFSMMGALRAPALQDGSPAVHPACPGLPAAGCRHPLADLEANARLGQYEDGIRELFDQIVPVLKEIAGYLPGPDFPRQAQELFRRRLGFLLPEGPLENAWVRGLDAGTLYASAIFSALGVSVGKFAARIQAEQSAGDSLDALLVECGFHAVNISACADGRLKGLFPYVLRLPESRLLRSSAYAGTLFDVDADVQDWQATELRRFREGYPTTADAPTRYLKVAVYHRSSLDPNHEGCAAHGSNEKVAVEAALERLEQFRSAIENAFCCGASTDILLIGVDTDTDAIRIHVPDAKGQMSPFRYVDNADLYGKTVGMDADHARLSVYEAIRQTSEVSGWGQGEGLPHDGMRRLIATLLISNLGQIEYVAERYGGWYPDRGHGERFVSVGDGFQEIQVRNLAYFARLDTVEEGAADLDVGVKIFRHLNVERGLPIPMAVHYRFRSQIPGDRDRVVKKLNRVAQAVRLRYADLDRRGLLVLHGSIQDWPMGSPLEEVILA